MTRLLNWRWSLRTAMIVVAVLALGVNWYRLRLQYQRDLAQFEALIPETYPSESHLQTFQRLTDERPKFCRLPGAQHFTARHCDLKTNRRMVALGADVNQRYGWWGGNALSMAMAFGDHDVGAFLLNSGADPNRADWAVANGNASLLAYLCEHRRLDDVKLLCSYGAAVNDPDEANIQPLDAALVRMDLETIKFLLDRGAKTENGLNGMKDRRDEFAAWSTDENIRLPIRADAVAIHNLLDEKIKQMEATSLQD